MGIKQESGIGSVVIGAHKRGNWIRSHRGLVRIEELCQLSKGNYDTSGTVDTTSGPGLISHQWNLGTKKVLIFTLKSGIKIGLSEDHFVEQWYLGMDSSVFVKASDLRIGNFMITKRSSVFGPVEIPNEEAFSMGKLFRRAWEWYRPGEYISPALEFVNVTKLSEEPLFNFLCGACSINEDSLEFVSASEAASEVIQQIALMFGIPSVRVFRDSLWYVSFEKSCFDIYAETGEYSDVQGVIPVNENVVETYYSKKDALADGLEFPDWLFDEIVGISLTRDHAYSLSVADLEKLVANGVSVHN